MEFLELKEKIGPYPVRDPQTGIIVGWEDQVIYYYDVGSTGDSANSKLKPHLVITKVDPRTKVPFSITFSSTERITSKFVSIQGKKYHCAEVPIEGCSSYTYYLKPYEI